ncbi:MAG: inner membrane CreD family protein [Rhodobacterales bacterium]|nr:inner membrane CreD family protein [Rhodobacterales bacterium]
MTDTPQDPSPTPARPRAAARLLNDPVVVKLALLGVLVLATVLAGLPIRHQIFERQALQDQVEQAFSDTWGASQLVGSPILVVPYGDTTGWEPGTAKRFFFFTADALEVTSEIHPETRRRGLFQATVFSARVAMTGRFTLPSADDLKALPNGQRAANLDWRNAFMVLGTRDVRGLAATDGVAWGGTKTALLTCGEVLPASHCQGVQGVLSRVPGDLVLEPGAAFPFAAEITVRGTGSFEIAPFARDVKATLRAPWPDPSFTGSAPPQSHEVTDDGFRADWRLFQFALPMAREGADVAPVLGAPPQRFGVNLIEATSVYRMIHRAAKYVLLFVVLAFATYVLFEVLTGLSIHLVQYGLLGASLSLFPLLLLALGETLGYTAGYMVSALLVLVQATWYTHALSRRRLLAGIFAAVLAGLFGFLYVLLGLETYALLVGTLALFAMLWALMALTQRVDWSGFRRATS